MRWNICSILTNRLETNYLHIEVDVGALKRLGVLSHDKSEAMQKYESVRNFNADYQFERNLSGVELEDGRILMVSKFGAMMVSENGLLGPYKVVSERIAFNRLPAEYKRFNYEDRGCA